MIAVKLKQKSGACKRKEAAKKIKALQKYPKVSSYFNPLQTNNENQEQDCQDINLSINASSAVLSVTMDNSLADIDIDESFHSVVYENSVKSRQELLSDDPSEWPPDEITDAQLCNIVERGPKQDIVNFPYLDSTQRRRFSSVHYKKVMKNGETVTRSWLVYSVKADKIFCFCCKLFDDRDSPFRSGMNTWEGLSKKLKDHENGSAHIKCFDKWMTLRKGKLLRV